MFDVRGFSVFFEGGGFRFSEGGGSLSTLGARVPTLALHTDPLSGAFKGSIGDIGRRNLFQFNFKSTQTGQFTSLFGLPGWPQPQAGHKKPLKLDNFWETHK